MIRGFATISVLFIILGKVLSQPYTDYIGAGHTRNVTISASSNTGKAVKTLNGSGLDGRFYDASRFLAQATLGADSNYIASLMNVSYVNWINDQFNKTPTYLLPTMNNIWAQNVADRIAAGQPANEIGWWPNFNHFNYAWWQVNMTNHYQNQNNDLLRQKVALALSEILVISANSDLNGYGDALSSYYDLLIKNSFGNYKTLLKDVSKSVAMGFYLSHLNNPKTNIVENIRPDENYAREIMQLFSIGLYKLNQDGSQQLDANGFPIPTYDNGDIKQMAKIFTGMHGSEVLPCPVAPLPPECNCNGEDNPPFCNNLSFDCCWWPLTAEFGEGIYRLKRDKPMVMDDDNHEPGPKLMPDKTTVINIPGDGMAEVDTAIHFLFNHQNTPPFVALRLIQRMVTSNPSPAYISRVAGKFINNGSGVRGDMKAVISQILLDPEARTSNYLDNNNAGLLKNPSIRYIHFCKSNQIDSDMGRFWNNGYSFYRATGHSPMQAPTVFNFYPPDYSPNGQIKDAGLVAPDFKVHNSSTSVNFMNEVFGWTQAYLPDGETEGGSIFSNWEYYNNIELDSTVYLETSYFESIADENERLIHEMNKVFAHGQLRDGTLNVLRYVAKTIDVNTNPNDTWWFPRHKRYKVRTLLYFLMVSPDYSNLK
jgi:uncharacterized protein (DUF1800 family)